MNKKRIIIGIIVLVVLATVTLYLFVFRNKAPEPVETLMGSIATDGSYTKLAGDYGDRNWMSSSIVMGDITLSLGDPASSIIGFPGGDGSDICWALPSGIATAKVNSSGEYVLVGVTGFDSMGPVSCELSFSELIDIAGVADTGKGGTSSYLVMYINEDTGVVVTVHLDSNDTIVQLDAQLTKLE